MRYLLMIVLALFTFPVLAQEDELPECPAFVIDALTEVKEQCANTGRDEVCYGSVEVEGVPQPNVRIIFNEPGDIVTLNALQQLLVQSNLPADEWGLALLRVRMSLDDDTSQNVVMLIFGDATMDDFSGNMQAFTFTSGANDAPCEQAPESGLLIQTPEGEGEITFLVNEIDIQLGSTAFIQTEPDIMIFSILEGEGRVTVDDEIRIVPAGAWTFIPIDENGNVTGIPSDALPYEEEEHRNIPINMLDREVYLPRPMIDLPLGGGLDESTTYAGETHSYRLIANQGERIIVNAEASGEMEWQLTAPDGRIVAEGLTFDHTFAQSGNYILTGGSPQSAVDYRLDVFRVIEVDGERTFTTIDGELNYIFAAEGGHDLALELETNDDVMMELLDLEGNLIASGNEIRGANPTDFVFRLRLMGEGSFWLTVWYE